MLASMITTSYCSAGDKEGLNEPVRLVITGDLKGTIRECHCPHGQPAGLARRKAIMDNLRDEKPEPIFIECGSLTDKNLREWELVLLGDLLRMMKYDVICCYVIDRKRISEVTSVIGLLGFASKMRKDSAFTYTVPASEDLLSEDVIRFVTNISNENYKIAIGTFTTLKNYTEDDEPVSDNFTNDKGWQDYISFINFGEESKQTLKVMICNWDYRDPDMPLIPETIDEDIPGLDVLIIGGSGNIEPEVVKQNELLVVYPGMYGEFIMVFDLWTENGTDVSKFEWETIPTETVLPDSVFLSLIDKTYKDRDKKFEK